MTTSSETQYFVSLPLKDEVSVAQYLQKIFPCSRFLSE